MGAIVSNATGRTSGSYTRTDAFRRGLHCLGAVGLTPEELLQRLLHFLKVDLDSLERVRNATKTDSLVRLGGAVDVEPVAVLLDDLAAVSDLVKAKCG